MQLVVATGIEVCCSSHSPRYFSALSKGEPLPVKERLEIPVATEKTDAALTLGLLKVLHNQVQTSFIKCTMLSRYADVLGMVGESGCQVFDVFWREFSVFLLWYYDFV